MAKDKEAKKKSAGKNERRVKQTETKSEAAPVKKRKLDSEEEANDNLELAGLTPEECRVLERKLKKELKKEEKRLKRESAEQEKEEGPQKPSGCELALQYLKSWSKKHEEWKFQKTRQTWLLLHMYDPEKVPDKYFKILLNYIAGLQGRARDTTVEKAEALMKQYDSSETQEEDHVPKLARIRDVLQILS
uniref:WKF domain-containing protein n=1 Tax=Xenopus tropicalis TaxID=8364 RepID=A0A803JGI5_XENTR